MKLVLIDGNSLLFRAYYATAFAGADSIMKTSYGFPTNAIYGLANLTIKILNDSKPDFALVAFDTSKPTFRHLKYQEYKAGRVETPNELKQQFLPARELLKNMGLFVYEIEGYEADDIIGTASKMAPDDFEVNIYSADRDLLQLISKNTSVLLTKKGVTDLKVMTEETLFDELSIKPSQITDLKGLMGDKSDNIPGVSGVGEKTAIKLLSKYQTVENIIEANDIGGKLAEKILQEKEKAIMSKKLATIDTDVPVEFSIDDLKYNGPKDELSSFYKKYEMYSLEKKLDHKKIEIDNFYFENVSIIPDDFYDGRCGVVLETTGNNYHIDDIIGLGLSNGSDNYFISASDLVCDKKLIQYLESKEDLIGLDIKKIICALNRLNIKISFKDDIVLATYLLESSIKDDPAIIFNYYGYDLEYRSQVFNRNLDEQKVKQYCAKQAFLSTQTVSKIEEKLATNNLLDLYKNVEIPLAHILAEMEINGIKVDKILLEQKSKEIKDKINQIAVDIYNLAGETFNINSPSQVANILFDKLNLPSNKKRSTNADELNFLYNFHPIVPKLLEYRQLFKLYSGYYEGLKECILDDGRIHTIYNQALTQTGRLSSRDPNMQNISIRSAEGKEVRKVFICGNDKLLISFDYSQIELRVLASMANETTLKQAFLDNIDIHTDTATKIFNVSIDQVTREQRRQAKTINFGIMYGMSEFELARELNIGFGQAKEFMNKYFDTYPLVKNYFNGVIEECKKNGYLRTKFNRIRRINEINSSIYLERERGKRIAMNTPIQGSAADIVKMQMIKVHKAIRNSKLDIKMLLQVHDEIVFEIYEKDLDEVIKLIKTTMEDFDQLDVPLIVDYHYGKNWME